jgi:hypothetical protein
VLGLVWRSNRRSHSVCSAHNHAKLLVLQMLFHPSNRITVLNALVKAQYPSNSCGRHSRFCRRVASSVKPTCECRTNKRRLISNRCMYMQELMMESLLQQQYHRSTTELRLTGFSFRANC